MRHWRLFEDLIDMQIEANRFFNDVYRRLAMFELALSRWNALDTLETERTWRQLVELPTRTVLTERRVVVEGGTAESSPRAVGTTRQIPIETDSARQAIPSRQPDVEVFEDANAVTIRADLPGLQPGDVRVTVAQNALRLSGKIEYSMPLPEGVDESRIRAIYRNGRLEVTLPKPSQGREIEVVFEEPEQEPYY